MLTENYIIDDVIEKEKIRNREMRLFYTKRLLTYPKGSLTSREKNGRKYYYFKYRDGKKIITKYAGTESKLCELQEKITERNRLLETIKKLDAEYEKIEKIERVK